MQIKIRQPHGWINPKNNDYKCFQYAIIVAWNHEQIKSHLERISNIKPFIVHYDWKEKKLFIKSKTTWMSLKKKIKN